VIPLPSADTGTTDQTGEPEIGEAGPVDEARQALLEAVSAELGDALVETELLAGRDLWLRVTAESWAGTADYLRNRQRFRFFDWLSAIDWLPSPFGRSHDAAVDHLADGLDAGAEEGDGEASDDAEPATGATSRAGGATRFQVVARVYSLTTLLGVNVKADLGPDLTVGTWTGEYPGANWHEREAHEMFGITFTGHPSLRNLYLPTDFEGHPLRKDYPLLARLVKPWPGIVDVELMPEAGGKPTATNPEAPDPEGAS
jgi:NADH-quinone oxidoreductase subunit C